MSVDIVKEELALHAAIRKQMDAIVVAATEAVQLLKSTSSHGNVLEKNQIRNVLNVAEESQSVQVVTNFILYQIGRSGTGRGWQHNGFGLRVVNDITEPTEPVCQSLEALVADLENDVEMTQELCTRAHVELMRHYLGYLNRAFTFATSKADTTADSETDSTWDILEKTAVRGHSAANRQLQKEG